MNSKTLINPYWSSMDYTLPIRLVIGWTYFSAFWRRLILENKLMMDEAGYIGEKFNHFLPHALGIKPIIEYLVTHPEALWYAMVIFTIVEAIVGLCMMLGLFTRLAALGTFMLAMGILLGSGWIGTTCLDEWQIGVLGIACGLAVFLSGSQRYALDAYLINRKYKIAGLKIFPYLASGPISKAGLWNRLLILGSIGVFSLTLFTNQHFHGAVFGKLHNKSVSPELELSQPLWDKDTLVFQVHRTEGADVYGSFLIGITLTDATGQTLQHWGMEDLANFQSENIHNYYVSKVKTGAHSLLIPLGARADLRLQLSAKQYRSMASHVILTDISGKTWQLRVNN